MRGRQRGECVIRCEVLGAALCSLKGSGCCPALCSSSTVLHVSHHPPSSSHHLSSPFRPSFLPRSSLPPFSGALSSRPSVTATKRRFATVVLIDRREGRTKMAGGGVCVCVCVCVCVSGGASFITDEHLIKCASLEPNISCL